MSDRPDTLQTEVLDVDPAGLDRAAALLRAGQVVAFPTETVYGLGGDGTDDRAVAAIFAAKGRPRINPLILHVAEPDAAAGIAEMSPRARDVAAAFWPGPLTLVLSRRAEGGVSLLATAGLDTVAVRVPRHATARALLARVGRPVAAPSANASGGLSPTRAAHVLASLGGRIAAVVDGGPCSVGVESTVVDLTGPAPVLLRPGGLSIEELETVVGPVRIAGAAEDDPKAPRSPGRLLRHYAPRTAIRLDARSVEPGEALLAFGATGGMATSGPVRNLSPAGDPTEAAANLFAMLHDLDALAPAGIAVMSIPDAGLGQAVNDRLRRAAAAQMNGGPC